jgi:hypothetical protein
MSDYSRNIEPTVGVLVTANLFCACVRALAAAVITAGRERGMRFKKLQEVRKLANRLSPDEASLALYRTSLVLQLGSRCVQGTGFEKPGFNRGASLHEVREDQYNRENSLAAIMIAASILRESQELRQGGMLLPEGRGSSPHPMVDHRTTRTSCDSASLLPTGSDSESSSVPAAFSRHCFTRSEEETSSVGGR